MGLAGPRKRAKISNDPNNTAWSRSTTGFGHGILRSQGWNPGENLGAKNAPHAHLHTAGSTSHIRVSFREGNLGLGAKQGGGQLEGQCTGLDAFQNILSRLNGKTEEVIQKEQTARSNVHAVMYTERRWGTMRFVNGGILEGTVMKPIAVCNKSDQTASHNIPLPTDHEVGGVQAKRSKKDKKDKKKKRKRDQVDSKEAVSKDVVVQSTSEAEQEDGPDEPIETSDSKTARKAEKALRKAQKALRKQERQQRREEKALSASRKDGDHAPSVEPTQRATEKSIANSSHEEQPAASPAPMANVGRHAVRSRFIAQKRMAMMDPKALAEILMVKAK